VAFGAGIGSCRCRLQYACQYPSRSPGCSLQPPQHSLSAEVTTYMLVTRIVRVVVVMMVAVAMRVAVVMTYVVAAAVGVLAWRLMHAAATLVPKEDCRGKVSGALPLERWGASEGYEASGAGPAQSVRPTKSVRRQPGGLSTKGERWRGSPQLPREPMSTR